MGQRQHTADGRLTLDELEHRVEEVLRARTGGELRLRARERRQRGQAERRPTQEVARAGPLHPATPGDLR